MPKSISIPVTEPSQVGEARRKAQHLAQELGLDETTIGSLGIIVTEIGTNLQKHARQGEIVLRKLRASQGSGIEILSIDRGPGMNDVSKCLRDGYSTTGTTGSGLGSIQRLSTVFDLYSSPQGTVLLSQLWGKASAPATAHLEIGVVCLPCAGETLCGDAWSVSNEGAFQTVLVADGLGHGAHASEAAALAVAAFEEGRGLSPQFLLQKIHGNLRSSRGAAVLALRIDLQKNKIACSGIGNVCGVIVAGETTKSVVSLNGTLGHAAQRFQEFFYDWTENSLLLMHSDGLQTKWRLSAYAGLQVRHPAVIAGVLYRDFTRGRDDVTVLVARQTLNAALS